MNTGEHVLLSWHISQWSGLDRRGRMAVTLCGVIADIDFLPVMTGNVFNLSYHRTFGHSLLFGVLLVAVAASVCRRSRRVSLFCALTFLLHLFCDILGTRHPVRCFWPFSMMPVGLPVGWELGGWQNQVLLVVLLLLAVPSAVRWRHSPFEFLSPHLDRFMLAAFVPAMRPADPCRCGATALGSCSSCGTPVCRRCHIIGRGFVPLCQDCGQDANGSG